MNTHDKKVIERMIEHSKKILSYCADCNNMEQFSEDDMRVEACVFNLMQIGELAHSELSEQTKKEIQSIPWKEIYGMRNRIVHGYDEVNMIIVWETIQNDLDGLITELQKAI